jgi:beta-glucanase (GH16 family)
VTPGSNRRQHGVVRAAAPFIALVVLIGCTGTGGPPAPSAARTIDAAADLPPAAYVSAPAPYTDPTGRVWKPDTSVARGGRTDRRVTEVAGTANPGLYQSRREGVTGYHVPVPRLGVYAVTLFLAADEGTTPGADVFDVQAGGDAETGVDVAARAGVNRAAHVVLRAVADGPFLDVSLRARVGSTDVSALTVQFVPGGSERPRTLFADEFSGPAGTRPSAWRATTGAGWSGEDSLETFTDRPVNAALDGRGNLAITARNENYAALDGVVRRYTSARLTTERNFSVRYGRVAAKIRMPVGNGLLPGFWALGENAYTDGWPASGEIDVVEVVPPNPTVLGTLHGPDGTRRGYQEQRSFSVGKDLSAGFHEYTVDWYPDVVQFGFDGVVYGTVARADLPGSVRWVFDHPYYLLLSMSVGGWVGSPTPAATFPATLLIDYVRVTD